MPGDVRQPTVDAPLSRRWLRALRVTFVLMGICFGGFMVWAGYNAFFGIEAATERTQRLLNSGTLPRFELRDATLPEAVDTFRRALRNSGINERKVRVFVADSIGRTSQEGIERKASIVLDNISPMEAGKYAANLFDLGISVRGKEVRFHAKGDKPLIHWKFPTNFSPEARGIPLNPAGTYDLQEFFQMNGVSFPQGAWARMKKGSSEVEVFLDQDGIDLIAAISGCYGAPQTWKQRILNRLGFRP